MGLGYMEKACWKTRVEIKLVEAETKEEGRVIKEGKTAASDWDWFG
jgi:hypothetical protein